MQNLDEVIKDMTDKMKIIKEVGVDSSTADALAADFALARLAAIEVRKEIELKAKLKKTSVEAVRGSIYLDIVSKSEKKPTESMLEHILNTDKIVVGEENSLAKLEVETKALTEYADIFKDMHILCRKKVDGNDE